MSRRLFYSLAKHNSITDSKFVVGISDSGFYLKFEPLDKATRDRGSTRLVTRRMVQWR